MPKLQEKRFRGLMSRAALGKLAGFVLLGLSATAAWAQPVNDNFGAGTIIFGNFGSITGSNVNATAQPGEPVHAGSGGGKSVWFKWVAPFTGTISFSTAGSSYDTVIAVYTGTSVSALTLLAQNDDANFPVEVTSRVSLPVTAGIGYAIAVDGFLGDSGSINLSWRATGSSSAGNFFLTSPSTPSVPNPNIPFTPTTSPIVAISQTDAGGPAARVRVVRASGSAGRVILHYAITNIFYTNVYSTNIYGTNLFITNNDTNVGGAGITFSNFFITNYFTSNRLQNLTSAGTFVLCDRISGIQLSNGPQVTVATSSGGAIPTTTNLIVTNTAVPCGNSSGTNIMTNGTIVTTMLTNIFCSNVSTTRVEVSAINGTDYNAVTNATLIFDDFEMGKDIPLPLLPTASVPYDINKVLIVKILSVSLDPLESTNLAPPTIDVGASNALVNILRISADGTDPCQAGASVINWSQSLYTTANGTTNIVVTATRTGTDFSQDCNVTYSAGFGNGFRLQPGSDYAIPTNAVPGSSQTPDFQAVSGTLTWAAADPLPKSFSIPLFPNADARFNRDIGLQLSVPVRCVIGQIPQATVTILDGNNSQPAGAADRGHNLDNSPGTSPPFNLTPGANNIVYALAIQPDGKTILGGEFTGYNTVVRNHIARMNTDGSLDGAFLASPNSGANGFITSIALQTNGAVVVGGGFTSFNGTNRHGIARLNGNGSLDAGFNPGLGVDGTVWSVAVQPNGRILIAGDFTQVNGTPRTNMARLNANGSVDNSFNPGIGPDNIVNAMALQPDGKVLIGGDFTSVNNTNYNYLARLNADGTLDTSFNPGSGPDGTVYAITLQSDGRILIGGAFSSFNLLSRHSIARLNTDGSLDFSFDPGSGADNTIYSMAVQSDGNILIGGLFSSYNGTRRICLARVFPRGVLDTSFMDTAYNQFAGLTRHFFSPIQEAPRFLLAMALEANGNIMIGGGFQEVGGGSGRLARKTRLNVARIIGGATPGPGNIALSYPNYSADKFGGNAFITMVRTNGFLGPASVTFTPIPLPAGPGAAIPGADFLFGIQNPTWGPKWTGGAWNFGDFTDGLNLNGPQVFIPIINNTNSTGDLTLNMGISLPQGQDIFFLGGDNIPIGVALDSQTSAAMTIVDNTLAHGTIGFATPTYTVNENNSTATITLSRTNGSSGLVSVQYATTTGGTAVAGPLNDYLNTNGTVTFSSGQTNKSFNVPIINNSSVQPDRTVNLIIFTATGGATLGQSNAVLTIVDDDFLAGRVNFNPTNVTVHETDGSATFTVARTGGSSGTLSVSYASTDGSATNGQDYGAVSNTLSWNGGDVAAKTFTVPIIHNSQVTSNKTATMRIFNPIVGGVTNNTALGLNSNATLNIINDDFFGSPTLSTASYSVNENTGFATVTVNRLGGSSQTITVNYTTANGTGSAPAFAGIDYTAVSGTLTFNPGEFSKAFTIPIADDPVQNGNRSFFVYLTNQTPAAVTLGTPNVATVTIVDNESFVEPPGAPDPTFSASASFNDTVYALDLQADGKVVAGGDFTIANSTPRSRIARLRADGTLDPKFSSVTGGMDGSVRTLAVQSDGRILVGGLFTSVNGINRHYFGRMNSDGALDDTFDTGAGADNPVFAIAETFVGPPTNSANRRVIIGGSFASVNGFTRNRIARVKENGSLDTSFAPQGANGIVYAVAVYTTNDPVNVGKVLIGGDFTQVNGVPRNHIARLNVDGSVDTSFNPGAGPNDSVRTIAIQVDGKVLIGGLFTFVGPAGLNRIARLNPNGLVDPLFNPGVGADGVVSAIAIQEDHKILVGGGFTRANGVTRNRLTRLNEDGSVDPTINFGAGADNFVSAVVVQADARIVIGGGFTQFSGLSRPRIARIYGRTATGPGTIEFAAPTFEVSENVSNIVISVRRNGGTTGSASVLFSTSDGTAASGTHYQGVTNTLVFPTGEILQTVNIAIISNLVVDIDRTVNLTLSNPVGAPLGGQPTALLTIVNQNSGVNFSAISYTVIKNAVNGAGVVTILRSGSTSGTASVDFSTTTNGTAVPGLDYTPVSNTVSFADGQAFRTATVPVINNGLVEGDTTVGLQLTSPTNTILLSPAAAVLTIIDNNLAAGNFAFSTSGYSVSETGTNAIINVIRTNGSVGQVSINFATTAGGTAVAGVDYISTNGSVSFLDGETNKSFLVRVLHNPVVQGNRTVNLILFNPTGGGQIVGANPAQLTILDVDIGLSFDLPAYFVNETNASVTIGVRRLSGTNGVVSVQYATSNLTALAGVDYAGTNNTLNFASGEVFKTFTVNILRNTAITGNRIFNINLSNPSGTGQLVDPITTAVTILDADSGLMFSSVAYTNSESTNFANIGVLRTGNALGAVSVNFLTTDGTATSGVRYFATNGVLNFADGQISNSFNVALINDSQVQGDQTVNLTLVNPTGGAQLQSPSNAVLTITDDDAGFNFSSAGYSVDESGVFATITVLRSGVTNSTVSVNFSTSDGTAHAGVKYQATSGTLTFTNSEVSKSFQVSIIDNSAIEGNQTVNLALSSPSANASLLNPNAATLTIVDNDGSLILPAGAAMLAEINAGPANGGIDPGETVTLLLALRNALGQNTTNLVATLLATNGVTSPSAAQNYGVLVTNGPSKSRQFQFTANGTNGAQLSAILQLQDGASNIGSATFNFTLGRTTNSFTNASPITILDASPSSPYPSTINVSALSGTIDKVTATLSNLTHGNIADASILLMGPTGTNTLLMGKVGGAHPVNNVTLTFDDAGPALTGNAPVTGTFRPTQFATNIPFPASSNGPGLLPKPFGTQLGAFTNSNPNGIWSLYVFDDTGLDAGSIGGGWSLSFGTLGVLAPTVDLVVGMTASTNASVVSSNVTYTISITNAGPSSATGVTLSNLIPAGVTVVSNGTSQGAWTTNGGSLICSIGTLAKDGTATATLVFSPSLIGSLTNTVAVSGLATEANAANNAASVVTSVVVPTADLAIGVADAPDPLFLGSNLTYTVTITNFGPGTATNVLVTNILPAGAVFVSVNPPGIGTNNSGTVISSLGSIGGGTTKGFSIVARPTVVGTNTNDASVGSGVTDPLKGNNKTTTKTLVEQVLLTTTISGNSLTFTWPTNATGYVLETTTNLAPPAWVPVSPPPSIVGGQYTATVATTGTGGYFRLRAPIP